MMSHSWCLFRLLKKKLGKKAQEVEDICIADLCCYTAETNTTL